MEYSWIGAYGVIPALWCYEDGHLHPADMAEAEAIAYVNVLWEHQNTLWVGTAKGLFALDLASRAGASVYGRTVWAVGQ